MLNGKIFIKIFCKAYLSWIPAFAGMTPERSARGYPHESGHGNDTDKVKATVNKPH